ncbi:MAG: hypothetical protein QM758_02115 [Armatimonas sp.]
MKRRLSTIWLIAFCLLGNLITPALALACATPVPSAPATACPMTGKTQARCSCCTPAASSTEHANKSQFSTPDSGCECQIAPGPTRDAESSAIPTAPKTMSATLPVALSYPAPLFLALSKAPCREQPRTPQSLPRPPDSGRAPPVG